MTGHDSQPRIFEGRTEELARLRAGLDQLSVAVICGIAGVGKSALAQAYAASFAGPVFSQKVSSSALSTLADDLRRRLTPGPLSEPATPEERLADLVSRLEESRGLWVLDDLHHLSVAERTALLGALS